jgi:hypothetical protein
MKANSSTNAIFNNLLMSLLDDAGFIFRGKVVRQRTKDVHVKGRLPNLRRRRLLEFYFWNFPGKEISHAVTR